WLSLVAALMAMHWFLRAWVSHERALLGTTLMSLWLLFTLTSSLGHPDHFLELALCDWGGGLIARHNVAALVPVMALALLNRETSAFLGLLFFLASPLSRRHLLQTAGLAAVSLGVLGGLRWWRGWEVYDPWQITRNWEFLGLIPGDLD